MIIAATGYVLVAALAAVGGLYLANTNAPAINRQTPTQSAMPPSNPVAESVAPNVPISAEDSAVSSEATDHNHTHDTLTEKASQLADENSAPATHELIALIKNTPEWGKRAALAKCLRQLSDPDTLEALLPALMDNYGRGNTIFNEISDAIARMAQPDTVEALEMMHWQASVHAGQGHKVLRTIASVCNPPAKRALVRLAQHAESPALAAAAEEALKRLGQH